MIRAKMSGFGLPPNQVATRPISADMTASVSVTPKLSDLFTTPSILIQSGKILPGGLSSFSRFGDLPIEVRLLIWSLMLPGPRLVLLREEECGTSTASVKELRSDPDNQPTSPRRRGGRPGIAGPFRWRFRSPCPVPILLHICHESRSFASTYYKRCFGHVDRSEPLTYFRSDRDILYIDRWFTEERKIISGVDQRVKLRDFSLGGLDPVRYLAVQIRRYGDRKYLSEAFGIPLNPNIRGCPNVKVLCIVPEHVHYDGDEPELVFLQTHGPFRGLTDYNGCCHWSFSTMRPNEIPPLSRMLRPPKNPLYVNMAPSPGEGVPEICFAGVAPLEAAKVVIRMKEVHAHRWQSALEEIEPLGSRCRACDVVEYTGGVRESECLYRPAVGEKCSCGKFDVVEQ